MKRQCPPCEGRRRSATSPSWSSMMVPSGSSSAGRISIGFVGSPKKSEQGGGGGAPPAPPPPAVATLIMFVDELLEREECVDPPFPDDETFELVMPPLPWEEELGVDAPAPEDALVLPEPVACEDEQPPTR